MFAFGDSITYGSNASNLAATSYVALLGSALGVGIDNRAVAGACMLGTVDRVSILAEMLGVSPPSRHEVCVMLLGTIDGGLYGTDAGALVSFGDGLTTGLLHLTSATRPLDPQIPSDRLLIAQGRRTGKIDGCSVFVGDCLGQSIGNEVANFSPAARAAYAAKTAEIVATVAGQGRRVYLAHTGAAYDPETMSNEIPSRVHPNDAGHAAIKGAFYSAMQAAVA